MQHCLDGLRVLVTRPLPLGQELSAAISAAGGHPVYFPVLQITPVDQQQLKNKLATLDQFDWIIFISPQAVLQTAELIHECWPVFPAHIQIACVGEGTANILREKNFLTPLFPQKNWSSEGLLALPEFENITSKKIVLIKGLGGRDELMQGLTARGASVTSIIAYQRDLPTVSTLPAPVDVAVCTSGDSVKNLKTLLEQSILKTPLLVTSERIAIMAKKLKFKQIFLAKNASHHAILDELINVKGRIMTMEPEVKQNSVQPKKTFWLRVLIVLLICGLLAATAYYFVLQNNITKINNALLQKQIQTIEQAVSMLQKQNQALTDEIKNQTQSISTLEQAQSNNKDMWMMLEAQYLVKLADDVLHLENNTVTAIALLKRADDTVHNVSDTRLTDIRQALASDIAMLQAVQPVDVVGVYARLNALNEEVNQLPLTTKSDANQTQQTTSHPALPWWKQGLQQTLVALKKIVIIRYNANGTLPLLTPEQQDFLYQNLHAVMEKAMWGLLHKQSDVYRLSVQQALDWTKKYFMQDSQRTQAFMHELIALQQVDVHPSIPNNLVSMAAFENYFSSAPSSKLAP